MRSRPYSLHDGRTFWYNGHFVLYNQLDRTDRWWIGPDVDHDLVLYAATHTRGSQDPPPEGVVRLIKILTWCFYSNPIITSSQHR